MSSDNLLKFFGGAETATQLAAAVALRRKGSTKSSDTISNTVESINGTVTNIQETLNAVQGEFINVAPPSSPATIAHNLGRVPAGAVVVQSDTVTPYAVTNVTETDVELQFGEGTPTIVLWVF